MGQKNLPQSREGYDSRVWEEWGKERSEGTAVVKKGGEKGDGRRKKRLYCRS